MGGAADTPPSLQRVLHDRERFLAFALTAADLLVEVSPEGRIVFAAGAFEHRLGSDAGAWIGRPASALVAREYRPRLDQALDLLRAQERLPPTRFVLDNPAGTPMGVAGLRMPGPGGGADILCLTLSALPRDPGPEPAPPPPELEPPGGGDLRSSLEDRLRAMGGRPAALGLLEIAGPDGPVQPRPELAGRIATALAGHLGNDGLSGELAAGRYGVLSSTADEFGRIAAEIETLVRSAGLDARVSTTALDLDREGLSPLQATRALRYALDSYSRGGTRLLAAEGFDGGLAGFVSAACARAESFRRLIAERRFRLAFQPIVGLRDRRLHHYEALIRPLASPGSSLAPSPQEFVTFAETVGLSEELDWAVIETCAEAARRAGGASIACNISGLSLQSTQMRSRLLALLRGEPELARRMLIEITETAEIEDEATAVATVEALRELRMPLCIDDFGAGAAAFRYLRAFRVDYVKIDGVYVQAALHSERDLGFVASMVDLARNVGAEVVAERIETEAEATAMLGLGVGYGQGWLFGKPGPLPRRG